MVLLASPKEQKSMENKTNIKQAEEIVIFFHQEWF